MSRNRQIPSPAASGSHVLQVPENQSATRISGTLRLRAEDSNATSPNVGNEDIPSRRIRWSEDVVDNEGMGKKKSKGGSSPSPFSFLFFSFFMGLSFPRDTTAMPNGSVSYMKKLTHSTIHSVLYLP